MVGKKVVHHMMMSAKDAHYVGGLVNGARIVCNRRFALRSGVWRNYSE